MSKIALTPNASGTGTLTIASPDTNSDRTLTLPDNSGTVITTGTTTGIDASALSTGTVPTARLASGTADSTTYLRGDQTWQTISTTPTTDQVLTATAGAAAGAVGTYAFLRHTTSADYNFGATLAGSSLRPAAIGVTTWATYTTSTAGGSNLVATASGSAVSGTWQLMGVGSNIGYTTGCGSTATTAASLWLRIS